MAKTPHSQCRGLFDPIRELRAHMPQLNSHTAINTQCNQINFLKRLLTPWFVHTRKQIYSGVQCTAQGVELAPVYLLENKFLVWKKKNKNCYTVW